jgi:hypothetical protein
MAIQGRSWSLPLSGWALLGLFSFLVPGRVEARGDDDVIWVEAESARSIEVGPPNGWYNDIKTGLLSGGKWVSNFSDQDGLLTYDIPVAKPADYTLWVRANPVGAALAYRLEDGPWKEIDMGKGVDQVNMAADDRPDIRFLAWFKVGALPLKAGKITLSFKMHSNDHHHGAIDCFLLTTKPFSPHGAAKPGQKLGLAEPGSWAFEPEDDEYSPKALLDLRSLNERLAGESGWVQRTPSGDFVLGNGKPVRFWAAGTDGGPSPDPESIRRHARFLAKRGINMIRLHCELFPKEETSKVTDVDGKEIEKIQKIVAAMKAEGIYTTISPYWGVACGARPGWGIKGHPSGSLMGTLFWDETLQEGYKSWIRELFTRKNPYGPPLAREPAIGLFQIQNEDSLLFWTIEGVKGEERRRLCQKFGAWAAKKYGSLEKTKAAWEGTGADGDDWKEGVLGLLHMWEFDPNQTGGRLRRLGDTLQFFSETMFAFNKMIGEFIHKDLGCKVLINAGNWYTANNVIMLDAEHWSYTANDVIGMNFYVVGGAHINPTDNSKTGWLVAQGDYYQDASMLHVPRRLPTNRKLVVGYPYIISENTWVPPMSHQAEAPFLVAAYSSLTGFDTLYWFALGSLGYDRTINKWQAASPTLMGGWPGTSLLFRRGYVKRGDAAVHEERSLDDLWSLKSAVIAEDESFDPNRHTGHLPKEVALKGGVNPLAFLVGPVEVKYGGDPAKTTAVDFSKYIDEPKKTVRSITGELTFNYDVGWCSVDAPKAQGATGFLAQAGPFKLRTVTIDSKNDYGAVLAVPLDDQDLGSSGSILVQVTTLARPYRWKETPTTFKDAEGKSYEGKRIDDTGVEPWNVVETKTTIIVKNPRLKKGIVLDPNGMPIGELPGEARGGEFTLKLPSNALYVVLQ